MVANNEPVQPGKTYTIEATEGMLLIAYPNQEVDTEFEFVYQLIPKVIAHDAIEEVAVITPTVKKLGEDVPSIWQHQMSLIALFASLVAVMIISICAFCACKKKAKSLSRVINRASVKAATKEQSDEEKGNLTVDKHDVVVFNFDEKYEGQTGLRVTPVIDHAKKATKESINLSRDDATI